MDTAGNLFGVTAFGGNSGCRGNLGCGVIYKITPDGGQSVVHAFCSENNCTDGELPLGRLSIDAGGDLFGTTIVGGAHQGGTAFRLNGKGYQVVYDLCSGACGDTANEPLDGVILDEGGNLFGTAGGGQTNSGTVYQLTP
jgi:uncharacterized repeat protein (TIGR03803 family)